MKYLLILISLIISNLSYSQCYEKYLKAFTEREAFEVVDSTYDNIIISIREGNKNECYLGKVTVKNKKVLLDNFYVKLQDESYENVAIRFKTFIPVEIKNGISQIINDKKDRLYNVVFISHLKPKKQAYMRAPDFDLN